MSEKTIHLSINGLPVEVAEGTMILQAAKQVGIDIPHLCYHPDQRAKARCRICSVEVKGSRKLRPACATACREGMEVRTDTKLVHDTQRGILQLILADHNQDCLHCPKDGNCELQALCARFNIQGSPLPRVSKPSARTNDNPALIRDASKCVKCGRCIRACKDTQGIEALHFAQRSAEICATTAYGLPLMQTDCVLCGQCSLVCPTAAITERDDTERVLATLHDPEKHVIVQVAPSVRVALGDAFHLSAGEVVTGKMVRALRLLGFAKVFDTNFGADLTIMEEASELLARLQGHGVLPMMTSCSPGWVYYLEKHHENLIPHLSTAKSPMSMFGAVAKTYYAKLAKIDPQKIVTVSIMPCTAKKFEAQRKELSHDGLYDVDIVLTTRELAKLIRYLGVHFEDLPTDEFDSPLGEATGAGAIFGTTGGVMEAALRTAASLAGTEAEKARIEYQEVRGMKDIREATVYVGGKPVRVAIVHTLKAAKHMAEAMEKGQAPYEFIEVMACPGGCLGGGGQPLTTTNAWRRERQKALYAIDRALPLRKSHENPEIQRLYKDYLGQPLKGLAHELLHTHFTNYPKAYTFRRA